MSDNKRTIKHQNMRYMNRYGVTAQAMYESNRSSRRRPERIEVTHQAINEHNILKLSQPLQLPAIEYPTPDSFRKHGRVAASVIVPMFRSRHVLRDLIESWDFSYPDHEIVFIDDCCPDNSKDEVLQLWSLLHPDKQAGKLLTNVHNQGYGLSCNSAVPFCSGEILIFLNVDTRVTPGWIEPLVNAFEDETIGIVGNLQLKDGGAFDGTIDSAGSEWRWDHGTFIHIGRHTFEGHDLPHPLTLEEADPRMIMSADRDMVTGCCVAMPKLLFKYIGGFDSNYRVGYWEDSEICMRVKDLGYRVYFESKSKIFHKVSHSGSSGHGWQHDNRQFFFNKWVNTGRIDRLVATPRPHAFTPPQQILLRRSDAKSDVLMATAIAQGLKDLYPNCHITFCTDFPDVVEGNPSIDLICESHESASRLAHVYYDLDLCHELRPECNILDAYAQHVGVKRSDCIPYIKREPFDIDARDYIVFHVDKTSWAGRNWIAERWREVSNEVMRHGYTVVAVGTQKNQDIPCTIDIRGKTNVWQLADVIANAKLFVGIDEFPMNVAQAYNVPGVVFFGSVLPELRLYRENMISVTADNLHCLGCHHRKPIPCTFTGNCEENTNACMDLVTVKQMLAQIFMQLSK